MKSPLNVVIAGGGTGGHVYPGLAVAREFKQRLPDVRISFVGTASGLEARVIPAAGFPLDTIRSAGLKGKTLKHLIRGLALIPMSGIDAWRVISTRRPRLVIGVGGYSSGPVVLLAAARGIPTMVLEQNAVPGFTNRWLGRVVRAAAVSYESTLQFFPRNGFVAGNPVRPEFFEWGTHAEARARENSTAARPLKPVRVLVFGGSQGAHAINIAMIEAAPRFAASDVALAFTHQTGSQDFDLVRNAYARAGWAARIEPFLFDMEHQMAEADLVVSRAGATTLAEIAAAGRPSILIPLPNATDDHQRRNAETFVAVGAAELLSQEGLTGETLAGRVLQLARDSKRRLSMGTAARSLARPDAASRIVQRALDLVSL